METGLQKLTGRIATRFPALARLARSKSLLITGAVAAVSYASRFFDFGVRALDWAQRADFLWLRQGRLLSVLRWFVSPTGADLVFLVAVIAFLIAVMLVVNPKTKPNGAATTAIEPPVGIIAQPDNKLTFEIVENESEVRIGGGREIRRIEAKIKLRCVKTTDSVLAVRDFHASLRRVNVDASETTIIAQENGKRILDNSNMQVVLTDARWTLKEPITSYRWFIFYLEITPKIQASLSANYFLRVTMDAVGQEPFAEDIRVNNWNDAIANNSLITLRRNYQRTDEIERRDEEIRSLQEQITQISTDKLKAETERDGLKNQASELTSDLTAAKKLHKLEILNETMALRAKEDELDDAEKRINELRGEKLAIDNALQMAELKMGQWEWLTSMAAEQETEIDHWVTVEKCERGDLNLIVPLGSACTVRLCIFVRNKSRLDISLSNELGGSIKFEGTNLLDLKRVINSVTDVPSGGTGCLTIEQRLSPSDVQMLSRAQYAAHPQFFNFDELKVQIVGGKHSPDITAQPLVIGPSALAFPMNLLERGQRIRALAEVRGRAIQLYDSLTRTGDKGLPKERMERWGEVAQADLEKAYEKEAVRQVWQRVTNGDPVPSDAGLQRRWLENCIRELGAFLAELAGEYINRMTNNT